MVLYGIGKTPELRSEPLSLDFYFCLTKEVHLRDLGFYAKILLDNAK
jgi:hypothetical protein